MVSLKLLTKMIFLYQEYRWPIWKSHY